MKKLLLILTLAALISCNKNADNTVQRLPQPTTIVYIDSTLFFRYNTPTAGTRVNYYLRSGIKEAFMMLNINDGHGWVQRDLSLPNGRLYIDGSFFRYKFYFILIDNSISETTEKSFYR